MNHHIEAWEKVKPHLFGKVCEVTRKTPWGFKEDRGDIINKSVDEFLSEEEKYGTVILHILSGEGESKDRILKVLDKAYKSAVKIVILEHNPEEFEVPNLNFIEEFIGKEIYEYDNWGRNLLYAFTTMYPFCVPTLSDNTQDITYVNESDHGICKNNLIYTHTSEEKIDFKLPKGEIYWVIGGGIPYESMEEDTRNILIDSTLRQCVYAANLYGVEKWKLDMIYEMKDIKEDKESWKPHWRKVIPNGVKPYLILHKSLEDLDVKNTNIYVSTVDKKFWEHLTGNTILDAFTEPRDKIKLCRPTL